MLVSPGDIPLRPPAWHASRPACPPWRWPPTNLGIRARAHSSNCSSPSTTPSRGSLEDRFEARYGFWRGRWDDVVARFLIFDEDQGKSAANPEGRSGFSRLVTAVARAEVGIVMSLEVSRLSRNDADWHHLVHLCRWTGTLIDDEHGVCDPSLGADRMVLGIRGQVSELERDSSVHRMVEARWNKARRGEVLTAVPSGYDVDDMGRVSITSDQSVADAIGRVFEKFDELGTARQVFVWWQEQRLPFPARQVAFRFRPAIWVQVSYRAILGALHHPFYAGAYVFGRTQTLRELDPQNPRRVVVRRAKP